jgi:hypothetical protein
MKPIAIVPRQGREIGLELRESITCLKAAGIHACNPAVGRAFALIWVDDGTTEGSVEILRNAGLQATALTETDEVC